MVKLFGCLTSNIAQSAFKEIENYATFDKVCSKRLEIFTRCVYRLGKYKMKKGLDRWYKSVNKPLQTIEHNDMLALSVYKQRYMSRVFHAWHQQHLTKLDIYQTKTTSIA